MPIELHNADLSACEAVIERGLQSFIEVGQALQRIRDGRLYRDGFASFEAYCKGRWSFAVNYAHKQIAAAGVACTIVHNKLPPPPSESVARELTRAEDPVETWRKAVETAPDGKVTAAHVRSVVESHREPPPPPDEPETDDLPPTVDLVCQEPDPEPASARRPITVPPPEPEEDAPSAPMQSVADAWNEMTSEEQDDFLGAVGAVRFATLEALAEQRARDTAYSVRRESMATGSDGARMIAAVLDGADWALARLGLTWSSTEAEAKRAFKQASLQAHPDRGGTNEEFTAISRANAIVMR